MDNNTSPNENSDTPMFWTLPWQIKMFARGLDQVLASNITYVLAKYFF